MSRKRSRARERVGAKLKNARERHRISLRQVADATKISVSVLQALERDDISYLPGGVVGRGFVRSFAAAVHLDPESIVAEFVAQFPHESVNEGYRTGAGGERAQRDDSPDSAVKIRLDSASPLRVAAIALVSVALPVFIYFAVATPNALSRRAHTQTEPATPVRPDRSLAVMKSVAVPALTLTAGVATPSLRPPPPATAADSQTIDTASALARESTAPGDRMPRPLRVTLSSSAPSWVIASVDGRKAVSRLMEPGETETLEAGRELVVTAGNGDAISMTVNGAALGSLGGDSSSVTVRVNHANLETYLRRAQTDSTTTAQ
jgi:cytoskeleton protein RodZ